MKKYREMVTLDFRFWGRQFRLNLQAHPVSRQGKSDLTELAGGPINLHFYFKNAKLMASQFFDALEQVEGAEISSNCRQSLRV